MGLDPLQHSRLYRRVARPSIEQLHFVLRPPSGHGSWDGEAIFEYSNEEISGDLDGYPQLLRVAGRARDAYLPQRMAASAGG